MLSIFLQCTRSESEQPCECRSRAHWTALHYDTWVSSHFQLVEEFCTALAEFSRKSFSNRSDLEWHRSNPDIAENKSVHIQAEKLQLSINKLKNQLIWVLTIIFHYKFKLSSSLSRFKNNSNGKSIITNRSPNSRYKKYQKLSNLK